MTEPIQEIQGVRQNLGDSPPPQGYYTAYELELSRRMSNLEKEMALIVFGQEKFATKSDLEAMAKTIVSEIKTELNEVKVELRTELKTEINAVKTEINAVRTELKAEINAVRTELKADINSVDKRTYFLLTFIILIFTALIGICGYILAIRGDLSELKARFAQETRGQISAPQTIPAAPESAVPNAAAVPTETPSPPAP